MKKKIERNLIRARNPCQIRDTVDNISFDVSIIGAKSWSITLRQLQKCLFFEINK